MTKNTKKAIKVNTQANTLIDANIEKQKDDNAIAIIRGLDLLMAYACASDLTAAARMILSAKESLVYWAAEQNFYESPQDRFINKCMTDTSMLSLFDMMTKPSTAKDTTLRDRLIDALQKAALPSPQVM